MRQIGSNEAVDYHETHPPAELAGLVKCRWTLTGHGNNDAWYEQQATPDGCVELIQRHMGQSWWDGPQPSAFVVGLVNRPQPFKCTENAAFSGLRLWPWAWALIGSIPLANLHGRWQPIEEIDVETIEHHLARAPTLAAIGRGIITARTVAQMCEHTGMAPRALQRWFVTNVGVAPRHYLRLLRFQATLERLPKEIGLAHQAADRGFADQAHMTREFRTFAGATPNKARSAARGPFLA